MDFIIFTCISIKMDSEEELKIKINKLTEENNVLRIKIQELEERLGLNSTNSSIPT